MVSLHTEHILDIDLPAIQWGDTQHTEIEFCAFLNSSVISHYGTLDNSAIALIDLDDNWDWLVLDGIGWSGEVVKVEIEISRSWHCPGMSKSNNSCSIENISGVALCTSNAQLIVRVDQIFGSELHQDELVVICLWAILISWVVSRVRNVHPHAEWGRFEHDIGTWIPSGKWPSPTWKSCWVEIWGECRFG